MLCSNLRRWWDLHLLLMTLVLSALIPWRITFRWPDLDEDFLTGKRLHTGISGFAYFADAVYILDFALTFNCGFIRERDFVRTPARKKHISCLPDPSSRQSEQMSSCIQAGRVRIWVYREAAEVDSQPCHTDSSVSIWCRLSS